MRHKKAKFNQPNVEIYLKKIYELKHEESLELPNDIFVEDKWSIPEMEERKIILNNVKEQLSAFNLQSWSQHTKNRDPSTLIIKTIRNKYRPELLTQAWCKFYECLSNFDLIPTHVKEIGLLKSLHLCEAPGGFITALNHFLATLHPNVKLEWYASTLNPNYEGNGLGQMIPDDRLIRFTKSHWLFGADYTGDITKFYNHEFICNKINAVGKVSLVTADGSIDCMFDPGNQEKSVEFLHYCETLTALNVLEKGGSFVLKIFTIFEQSTICLIYLLCICFESVTIFKPITSKSGNSESYVICKRYKGVTVLTPIWDKLIAPYKNAINTKSMFKLADINAHFLAQIYECVDFFMDKQIATINSNIKNYIQNSHFEVAKSKRFNLEICNLFLESYSVNSIMNHLKIVPDKNITNLLRNFTYVHKKIIFKFYQNKTNLPELLIEVGKRVEKIQYSKFCTKEILENIRFNINTNDSLFNKSLNSLIKNPSSVINYSQLIDSIDQSDFQFKLFMKIKEKIGLDSLMFINIPILTDFLVGLIYIITLCYKDVYFFKNGIISINHYEKINGLKIIEYFTKIEDKFKNVVNTNFSPSISQIIDIECIDTHFNECLWFFNNNLNSKLNEM